MRNLFRPLEDLLYMIYPHLCLACGENAPPYGHDLCTPCKASMPETNFHLDKDNPFTQRFWGRVELQAGAALYLFTKQGRVQHLLHNIKYNGKKQAAQAVGRHYGFYLRNSPHFIEAEVIVPVPLHPRKQYRRGYNQSDWFGRGLSETMGLPCLSKGLERCIDSESQTKKSKLDRLAIMEGTFAVRDKKTLTGRHVLLVDDVLTTGSTLEACTTELLKLPGTKVSIATIAMAVI